VGETVPESPPREHERLREAPEEFAAGPGHIRDRAEERHLPEWCFRRPSSSAETRVQRSIKVSSW
jgi:hypothetical protein